MKIACYNFRRSKKNRGRGKKRSNKKKINIEEIFKIECKIKNKKEKKILKINVENQKRD